MRSNFLNVSLIGLLAIVLMLTACENNRPHPVQQPADIPFRTDGSLDFVRDDGSVATTIAIEIAETDSARVRGLMQRSSLPPQSGMLFIFEEEEMQGFWMANTPLALDIIYVAADSTIVSIAKYTRPFSPESIPSRRPAQFVVEVTAGFTDRHGIVEGDRIRWERNSE